MLVYEHHKKSLVLNGTTMWLSFIKNRGVCGCLSPSCSQQRKGFAKQGQGQSTSFDVVTHFLCISRDHSLPWMINCSNEIKTTLFDFCKNGNGIASQFLTSNSIQLSSMISHRINLMLWKHIFSSKCRVHFVDFLSAISHLFLSLTVDVLYVSFANLSSASFHFSNVFVHSL